MRGPHTSTGQLGESHPSSPLHHQMGDWRGQGEILSVACRLSSISMATIEDDVKVVRVGNSLRITIPVVICKGHNSHEEH